MTVKLIKLLKIEEVGYKYASVIDYKSYLFAVGGVNHDALINPSIITFERENKCNNACGQEYNSGECKDDKCICAPGYSGIYCDSFNSNSKNLKFIVNDITIEFEKNWFKNNKTVTSVYEKWKNDLVTKFNLD